MNISFRLPRLIINLAFLEYLPLVVDNSYVLFGNALSPRYRARPKQPVDVAGMRVQRQPLPDGCDDWYMNA